MKNRVTVSNETVNAREAKMENDILIYDPRFTLRDHKVMRAIFSLVSPTDTDLCEFRLTIPELMKLTDSSDTKLYKDIRNTCSRLVGSTVEFKSTKNPKDFEVISLFARAKYLSGEGYVLFEINKYMMPYLIQLKSNFTTYYLDQITTLKSSYSVRLYELLRQTLSLVEVKKGKKCGYRKISICDLREMIGVPENRYKLFSDFRKSVIERSQKELEEKTDLKFTFKVEKKGKQATHINLVAYPNIKSVDGIVEEAANANNVTNEQSESDIDQQILALLRKKAKIIGVSLTPEFEESVKKVMRRKGLQEQELQRQLDELDEFEEYDPELDDILIIPADFDDFDEHQAYRIKYLIPDMPSNIIIEDINFYGTAIYAETITQFEFALKKHGSKIKSHIKYFRGMLDKKRKEQEEHNYRVQRDRERDERTTEEKLNDRSWAEALDLDI